LLSGESEKSKRFHPRNFRTFYPQILRKSQKYQDPEDVPFVQVLVQPEYGYYTMEFYFDGIVREHEALQWTGRNESHPAIITWGNS
jgi:hypothetical protein